jgi:hypothetical protein
VASPVYGRRKSQLAAIPFLLTHGVIWATLVIYGIPWDKAIAKWVFPSTDIKKTVDNSVDCNIATFNPQFVQNSHELAREQVRRKGFFVLLHIFALFCGFTTRSMPLFT